MTTTPRTSSLSSEIFRDLDEAEKQGFQGVEEGNYDSDGHLDELLHDNGRFTGFAPGPRP